MTVFIFFILSLVVLVGSTYLVMTYPDIQTESVNTIKTLSKVNE